ncbi:hypothetical protein [Flavihumibacter petaseus]|uniref:Uncharacterized protein n=1 Tax=Flavihumibacter petaseus NBRC 106054 TaxID=1220578 RepID=A0A0E9MZ27_9BACT|nr:hypothetical protein [Flavihumibacter petaseus]GAO42982.1 hypothetical protein FPE01S_02_00870 [Flavihumibacter petaseus NBRC 106054]
MKKLYTGMLLAATTLFAVEAGAQKIKLEEGDLSALKGVKEINIEFDYSNMKVGKVSEADYVSKKKADYNKKEAGKGDTWEKAWLDDRETRYQPNFIQTFNQFSGMTGGPLASAKYTIIVKTTFTEPGYQIVMTSKSANINLEAIVVETADKSKVIGKISVEKSPGGGAFLDNDFDTGQRISEAYKNAGMSLGGFIRSKTM